MRFYHKKHLYFFSFYFLPRNALQCKARSCDRMSSVRPSVCLSVTLVICDDIGRKSCKLIVRAISPTPSLFEAKRRSTYSQGNMGKFGETMRWGREKWRSGEQNRQYFWNA